MASTGDTGTTEDPTDEDKRRAREWAASLGDKSLEYNSWRRETVEHCFAAGLASGRAETIAKLREFGDGNGRIHETIRTIAVAIESEGT